MTAEAPGEVSCVVVAFHRPDALRRLLAALHHPQVEIIVVNVDADPTVRTVAVEHGAALVDLAGNPGYAAAVNAGVRNTRSAVVVFLNDDVRTDASTIRALARIVQDGDPAVAVPRLVDGRGRTERSVMALPTPWTLALEWMALPDRPLPVLDRLVTVEKWRMPQHREEVAAAAATVVASRRDVLVRMTLPEAYFLYWEEAEWFWDLHAAGVHVVYDPSVSVVHEGGRHDVRPEKSRLLARNAVRCVRRTQGRTAAAAAWLVVIAWNARLLAVDAMRAALGSRAVAGPGTLRARYAGLGAALRAVTELR